MLLKFINLEKNRTPEERFASQELIKYVIEKYSDTPIPTQHADKPFLAILSFFLYESKALFSNATHQNLVCAYLAKFLRSGHLCLEDILFMGQELGIHPDRLRFLEKNLLEFL